MNKLEVVVNNDLTLDAGGWEEVAGERLVHPPARTMYFQLLDYLDEFGQAIPGRHFDTRLNALITTCVCLRWGSYFAVLADPNKVLSPHLHGETYPSISHISDGEMARINIEASAAMAHWLDLYRQDRDRYDRLAQHAYRLLPFAIKSLNRPYAKMPAFVAVAYVADQIKSEEFGLSGLAEKLEAVRQYPSRIFANALVNYAWRNGPIEDIHAGKSQTKSLRHRHITPAAERELVRDTAARVREGFRVLDNWSSDDRPWAEKVVPYQFAQMLLVTPTGWSVTAETTEVILAGLEPQD